MGGSGNAGSQISSGSAIIKLNAYNFNQYHDSIDHQHDLNQPWNTTIRNAPQQQQGTPNNAIFFDTAAGAGPAPPVVFNISYPFDLSYTIQIQPQSSFINNVNWQTYGQKGDRSSIAFSNYRNNATNQINNSNTISSCTLKRTILSYNFNLVPFSKHVNIITKIGQ